jgi:hypothetical protein
MKNFRPLCAFALWALALLFTRTAASPALPDGLYAEFTTPRGTFTTELFFARAPLMCANFVSLAKGTREAKNGKSFYTGLTWYRVVPGLVIQRGNPGLRDTDDLPAPVTPYFPDEFAPASAMPRAAFSPWPTPAPTPTAVSFFSPSPRPHGSITSTPFLGARCAAPKSSRRSGRTTPSQSK